MSVEFPFRSVKSIGVPGFFGPAAIPSNVQSFNSPGAFTWTKPTPPSGKNIIGYFVSVVGAGCGGASGDAKFTTNIFGGQGGSGGGYASANFTPATFPATVSVTVGLGGTGGATQTVSGGGGSLNGLRGTDGQTSSFGTFISAHGGVAFPPAGGTGTVTGPGASNPFTQTGGVGGLGAAGSAAQVGGSVSKAGNGGGGGGGLTSDGSQNWPGAKNGRGTGSGGANILGQSGVVAQSGTDGGGGGGSQSPAGVFPNFVSLGGQGGDAQEAGDGGGGSGGAGIFVQNGTLQVITTQRGGNGGPGAVTVITLFG